MSAYTVPLKVSCDSSGCKSRATTEVFNTFNARQGRFCRRHASQKLADLKRHEVAAVRAATEGDRRWGP